MPNFNVFFSILKIIMHTSRREKRHHNSLMAYIDLRLTFTGKHWKEHHYKLQNPSGKHDFSKWKSMGSTNFPRM